MTDLYIIYFQDDYNDYHSEHTVAIWLDANKAADYAENYPLGHGETMAVKKVYSVGSL